MVVTHTTFRSVATKSEIHRVSAVADDDSIPNRGTVMVLHGLGDHSGCHEGAMEIFCQFGFRAEGFDWPGNGRSEGNRGDIPGVKPAMKLLMEVIESLDEKPVAIYAHSTGAFLAIPFITRYGKDLPLRWVWLSSPLVRPTHRQSRIKIWAAEYLADFAPELVIPTGVKPSRCYQLETCQPSVIAEKFKDCHSKISARFGRDLILWEREVSFQATQLKSPIRILITQGEEDQICPPEFAEELFLSIPAAKKTFIILKNIRHEPFKEPKNKNFLDFVTKWLDINS